MKSKTVTILLTIATLLFITTSSLAAPLADSLGTAITYQGRLDRGGQPYTGSCDFEFSLWDAASDGSQFSATVEKTGLIVNKGLFTTQLDFGAGAFSGDARWLEVAVLCSGDSIYTSIGRQELTAAPYSLYAASAPWSGLTGVPSGFTDNVDDNTTYTKGSGLNLSGTEFSIDPAYTQRRVSSDCTTGSSIQSIDEDGTVTCETDENTTYTNGNGLNLVGTTFSINPTDTQQRVSGTCSVGSTIRAINDDGSVVCQTDLAAPSVFSATNLDTDGDVGLFTAIVIGSDGLGLISYYDRTNESLKVAHCINSICSSATITSLDSTGVVGTFQYHSITIGRDGLGLISYYNASTASLKVAHCNDIDCTNSINSTIDTTGTGGVQSSSITIGRDGLGLISYYDDTTGYLKAAHCSNINCTSSTTSTVDSSAHVGWWNSITIGTDGLGLISYYDVTNGDLKVAYCSNVYCTGEIITTLDSTNDVGRFTSITVGVDGLGLISYKNNYNGTLKVAHCSNPSCTVATITSFSEGGYDTSISIGSDGLGIISYHAPYDLRSAHCNDLNCTGASINILDNEGSVGEYTSITIGADGLPLISYNNASDHDLKVIHCINTFCIPYFRRR